MALFERGCAEACILPGGCGREMYEPFFLQSYQYGFVIDLSLLSSLRAKECCRCGTFCRLRTREPSLSLCLSCDRNLSLIVIGLAGAVMSMCKLCSAFLESPAELTEALASGVQRISESPRGEKTSSKRSVMGFLDG